VEGRIVLGSVGELERECRERLRSGKRVRLDLSSVTYVDPRGTEVLQGMTADGVEIINQSTLIDDLLGESPAR
jgi:anti-anti-sigma regulatory factor